MKKININENFREINEKFNKTNESIEKILKIKKVKDIIKLYDILNNSLYLIISALMIYVFFDLGFQFYYYMFEALTINKDIKNLEKSYTDLVLITLFLSALFFIIENYLRKSTNNLILKQLSKHNINVDNFKDFMYIIAIKRKLKKEDFDIFDIDDKFKKIFQVEFKKYCSKNNLISNILLKRDFELLSKKLNDDIELKNKEDVLKIKDASSINILEDFAKEEKGKNVNYNDNKSSF